MPVLKVIKNKNYTVMFNNHLFDKNLSLKSIGLCSIILSLPNNWKYSLKGLQSLTNESYRSIKLIIRELKNNDYVGIYGAVIGSKDPGFREELLEIDLLFNML